MARPKLERNGVGDGQEMSLENAMQDGIAAGIIAPERSGSDTAVAKPEVAQDSPAPVADAPVKQVMFRSVDKELALYYKAGFTDKSHGLASYTPSVGVKFEDYMFRIDDTKENAKTIAWLRGHPNFGITFREVPDMSNVIELPPIKELRQMTLDELKGLCSKYSVKHELDASKDSLILALLENQ